MPTYLNTPSGPMLQPAAAHPSTLAYLSPGSPLRQAFLGLVNPMLPGFRAPGVDITPVNMPSPSHPVAPTPAAPPPPPAAAAPPGPGAGAGAPPQVDVSKLSYLDDPILQQTLAQRDAALKTLHGNVLSQYEDLLLGFGSQELAKTTLGQLLKTAGYSDVAGKKGIDKLVKTISDNPDTSLSTLAKMARALREATKTTNENVSSSAGGNLFFSGAHARGLRELDYQHQSQVNDATQALRQALFGVMQGAVSQEQQWAQTILEAEGAAYERAIQVALANAAMASGYGAGGGPAPGEGDTGAPASSSPNAPANATPASVSAAISAGVPWNVAQALSTLAPSDIRVRRLM